jgi:hypothetical protein
MTDEQIDIFARRAAKGNNGGDWAEHYTEDQKEFWRRFVRDMETTMREYVSGNISGDEILIHEPDKENGL